MAEPSRVSFRCNRLASRKAEEAACRRFQAAVWLQNMVGPLDLPSHPTEQEFVSCLKSGLILCNVINKIRPGAIPKVVANQPLGLTWENQALPAYQYFENIRNFLVAIDELKIPSFEASDLERDTMEAGSVGKIVDCILGLKAYHEWKQYSGSNGSWKYVKSPMVSHINVRSHSNVSAKGSSVRCLDVSSISGNQLPMKLEDQSTEDKIDTLVKAVADSLFSSKENIDQNIFDSWRDGTMDPVKIFNIIISSCLQEQQLKFFDDRSGEGNATFDVCIKNNCCKCRFCLGKASCTHWKLVESQEFELEAIKALLSRTKLEFSDLQYQVQNDLARIGFQIQGLSTAAVGYDQAVKENRNLHNMLQELKGNIRVFCRVRPAFIPEAKCSIDYIGNDGTLILLDPLKSQNLRRSFHFNKVFGPNSTQEVVYNETQSLVRSVMDGYNVCIFAYGQTGSGKTYSMCGPAIGSAKDMGINSKALNDLFQISCSREDIKYEIHVQMVEIYNEQVRDLLSEEASTTKLEIRNCTNNGGSSLPDATMHHVQSTSDVMNLMKVGEKNRAFSCTAMNSRSSRSHSVLTIHVCGRDISGNILRSSLHLVDLAGSERVDRSEVTGDRLKEAQHINKSLSCLGDVIAALAQKSSHIPYRNSKLTLLLQNSLGGHAKMLMLAHVSPEAESYGETVSTLKFAQRVSTVELGAAHVNKEGSEIRELREQVDALRKELASKEREKPLYLHKMKENTSILEASKHNELTPPLLRPRGLSLVNGGVLNKTVGNYPDERKLLIKSPLPRPKLSTEHSVARSWRLSLEGSRDDKNQRKTKNFESEQQSSQIAEQLKKGAHEEAKANAIIKSSSPVNETEDLPTCSPSISGSPSVNQLKVPGNRFRQLDEVVTPDTQKIKLSSSSTLTSTKGLHFRRSLLTIGKFINRAEKRNYQGSSVMPAMKLDRDVDIIRKSPATAESRFVRRQSLTNVQAIEIKASRRSSLGGKSVESCPTGIRGPRTPPAFPASMKTTRPWF